MRLLIFALENQSNNNDIDILCYEVQSTVNCLELTTLYRYFKPLAGGSSGGTPLEESTRAYYSIFFSGSQVQNNVPLRN